jgi:hypothetical protein
LWLIGINRRVWWVQGPPGSGPSETNPAFAAELVGILSEEDEDGQVEFTAEDVKGLILPGSFVEKDGWRISVELVNRFRYGKVEWDGF